MPGKKTENSAKGLKRLQRVFLTPLAKVFIISRNYGLFNLPFYLKKNGLAGFIKKLKSKIFSPASNIESAYPSWIRENEPGERELAEQKSSVFGFSPLISIVTPLYETPPRFLREMMDSVFAQTYSNWELCLADGGSTRKDLREALNLYGRGDKRIRIKFLEKNLGIAINSNEAVRLASGGFIAFLDHDDTLAPFALYEVVKALNQNPDADFIYSDEDKITENGKRRFDPHFKPDFSPDLLRSYNYITHLSVVKKGLLEKTGFLREGFEGAQDFDLILRITEKARKIIHIPKILYHWRISPSSAAVNPFAKPYAFKSGKRALEEHLKRTGLEGKVEKTPGFVGSFRTSYKLKEEPLISIIIPNRDNGALLSKCANSIISGTSYKNFEIIIIENKSAMRKTFELYDRLSSRANVKIAEWTGKFNWSAANNFGARHASGSLLLFLNNDTEVISGGWLGEMASFFTRKEVGAVGAKLYFPGFRVQHAGVVVGMGGAASHPFYNFPGDSPGYMNQARVIRNVSAVTGACMMTSRAVFEAAEGFDEGYPLAYSDVDYCLKVRQKGFLVIFTPYAELYHHESATRGYENSKEKQERFLGEAAFFREKWSELLESGDPYHNPNLSLLSGP